jgi:hypothetical protein
VSGRTASLELSLRSVCRKWEAAAVTVAAAPATGIVHAEDSIGSEPAPAASGTSVAVGGASAAEQARPVDEVPRAWDRSLHPASISREADGRDAAGSDTDGHAGGGMPSACYTERMPSAYHTERADHFALGGDPSVGDTLTPVRHETLPSRLLSSSDLGDPRDAVSARRSPSEVITSSAFSTQPDPSSHRLWAFATMNGV